MSLLKKKHGTRKSYLNGCRCKDCCAANSAYIYARRFVAAGRFDVDALSKVSVTDALVVDGGKYVIPDWLVTAALRNLKDAIVMEILTLMWHRGKKGVS